MSPSCNLLFSYVFVGRKPYSILVTAESKYLLKNRNFISLLIESIFHIESFILCEGIFAFPDITVHLSPRGFHVGQPFCSTDKIGACFSMEGKWAAIVPRKKNSVMQFFHYILALPFEITSPRIELDVRYLDEKPHLKKCGLPIVFAVLIRWLCRWPTWSAILRAVSPKSCVCAHFPCVLTTRENHQKLVCNSIQRQIWLPLCQRNCPSYLPSYKLLNNVENKDSIVRGLSWTEELALPRGLSSWQP